MLNAKYFLIPVFLLIIIVSCKRNSVTTKENKVEIFIKDSVEIPISTNELYYSRLSHTEIIGGKTILYRTQDLQNSVDIYDWDEKQKIKRVSFNGSGPNSVSRYKFDVVHPIDNDNFFVGSFFGDVYLVKNDSVIYHKGLIDNNSTSKDEKSNNYFIQATNMRPSIKIDSLIYCGLGAFSGKLWSKDFYDSKLQMKFNYKSKAFKKSNLSFPKIYRNKCWGIGHYSLCSHTLNNKNQLIYLFSIEPTIHIFDLKENKIVFSKTITSKYASKINKVNCNVRKKITYLRKNSFYSWIRYDDFNDVYYLLIRLPFSSSDMDIDYSIESYTIAPFSLLILDNSFNVISEKKFKGKRFNFRDFFITEKGLWISNNSPYNPFFDEDKIKYSLFSYRKRKD